MANYIFGVDVGGTTVKMGLFDKEGNVLEKWEIPTRTENHGEKILPDIAASIKEKMAQKSIAKEDVVGVGIGTPGPVEKSGIVHKAVNLGWAELNMKEELTALLDGMRVEGGNDANVAALGEMWKGGGQGNRSYSCGGQRDGSLRLRQLRLSGRVCVRDRHHQTCEPCAAGER